MMMALALGGCALVPPPGCPAGLTHAKTAELFFGRNVGAHHGVSDAAWQSFVDGEIAPRFPNGFTITDMRGSWRGQDGVTVHERSERLLVVLSGKPGEQEKLEEIRTSYKARFHQESVMLLEGEGCVSF